MGEKNWWFFPSSLRSSSTILCCFSPSWPLSDNDHFRFLKRKTFPLHDTYYDYMSQQYCVSNEKKNIVCHRFYIISFVNPVFIAKMRILFRFVGHFWTINPILSWQNNLTPTHNDPIYTIHSRIFWKAFQRKEEKKNRIERYVSYRYKVLFQYFMCIISV